MFYSSFNNYYKRFLRLFRHLNSSDSIAGLELSDTYLRYIFLGDNQEETHYSLALPKGVVVDGQVRECDVFISALRQFKSLITRKKKLLSAILTISASNVYAQIVRLPLVSSQKINEVARLNLEMVSPIDSRQAYYDWQVIEENLGNREAQMNLFSAFVNRKIIDDISDCFTSAGFFIVAIEPYPLSVVRSVHYALSDILTQKSYLVFSLSTDGLDFIIVRGGSAHFNYFVSWRTLHDKHDARKKINIEDIKEEVVSELRRLLNYYTGEWGGVIEDLVFVSAQTNKEIATTIQDYFKFTVHVFTLPLYPKIHASWAGVFGAGLRGRVAREKDTLISLSAVGTEDQYVRYRLWLFFNVWRNIIMSIVVVILIVYGSFYGILDGSIARMRSDLDQTLTAFDGAEVLRLQERALQFNALVDAVSLARARAIAWSPFFTLMQSFAQQDISLTSLQIQTGTRRVVLQGFADSERKVLAFKTKLLNDVRFTHVSLPLTSISLTPEGVATFSLTFDLVE